MPYQTIYQCAVFTQPVFIQLHVGEILEKQAYSLVLFGLTLSSASWDQARSCLVPLQGNNSAANRTPYCAAISFKSEAGPHSSAQTSTPGNSTSAVAEDVSQFNCPVLLADKTVGDTTANHRAPVPLFHLPLAWSAQLGLEGVSKVHLSCDSEYHDTYM